MTRLPSWLMAIIAVVLAVFDGRAISAQDKYTAQVPNGLAFSEFKGYEDWKVISVSHSGDVLAVILGNPEMIAAYQVDVMQAVRHRRESGGLRARFRIPMDFRNPRRRREKACRCPERRPGR